MDHLRELQQSTVSPHDQRAEETATGHYPLQTFLGPCQPHGRRRSRPLVDPSYGHFSKYCGLLSTTWLFGRVLQMVELFQIDGTRHSHSTPTARESPDDIPVFVFQSCRSITSQTHCSRRGMTTSQSRYDPIRSNLLQKRRGMEGRAP